MSGYETLRFEVDGHVGRLRLHRPERLNAFTTQMWNEMRALGRALLDEPGDIRALVVSGEGRAFSSGIDTAVFADGSNPQALTEGASPRHADPTVDMILTAQDSYTWLAEAPFVTIAAIRGFALGAGLQLALACDIRIAGDGAKLGLLEHRYGILPDLGGTQRLPRIVGTGKAIELIATAATIDAGEAARIGLVERLVPDDEVLATAAALAGTIAAAPPLAVRGAKRAVHAALDGRSVRDGLVIEAENQAVCLNSADFGEAIHAFAEGRVPTYQGR
ncbi:MAG: enoyl-CoA hydratase [Acidimicrobiia bacterium]